MMRKTEKNEAKEWKLFNISVQRSDEAVCVGPLPGSLGNHLVHTQSCGASLPSPRRQN